MMHEFPAIEEGVAIHDIVVREFGGSQGLRDQAGLESAFLRPQLGYYNKLLEEAAALMESLAMNNPFVDGNKRTAFFATDTFLRMNGRFIDCGSEETYELLMQLFATHSFRFGQLHEWLEQHVKPLV